MRQNVTYYFSFKIILSFLLIIENKKGAEQKSIRIRGTAKNPKTRKTTPAPVVDTGVSLSKFGLLEKIRGFLIPK